jgi:hypothetical protein
MRRVVSYALFCLLPCGAVAASDQFESRRAPADVAVNMAPESEFWHGAAAIFVNSDPAGNAVPGYKMEVRTRWTPENLYFLFTCPYDKLYLNQKPSQSAETYGLWNWDVAEVFIGSDFKDIGKYKEFEASPQGEWVDLSIDLANRPADSKWNSGFEVFSRIDSTAKVWYAFMRIPYSSVDSRPAATGNELRVNFFLSAGPPASHKLVAWRPTGKPSFHVPEAFGTLRLVE